MSATPQTTFWSDDRTLPSSVRPALGHQDPTSARGIIEAESFLGHRSAEDAKLNARQLLRKLRGGTQQMDFKAIPRDHEQAPHEPNVYNDGSLKVPHNQHWSLGGIGVWWEHRSLLEKALNANESDYAYASQQHDGVEMWAPMPGFQCSSTRTEIAAGILALTADGPVHQASDNKFFVRFVNFLINHPVKGPRKPWLLAPDGDLWHVSHCLLQQKGEHAVRVTWVKAHLDQQSVEAGLITSKDLKGNCNLQS